MSYRSYKSGKDKFGSIKVQLSYGGNEFNAKDNKFIEYATKYENCDTYTRINIQDFTLVKRIKGSGQGDYLRQLHFGKKDGTQITEVKLENANQYGPETLLDDDEEIIGVYGTA